METRFEEDIDDVGRLVRGFFSNLDNGDLTSTVVQRMENKDESEKYLEEEYLGTLSD